MLHFVVCPQCRGDLRYTKEQVLFCMKCRLCFPVEGEVPNLSLDMAVPLSTDGKVVPKEEVANFEVVSGHDSGLRFRLESGTCRALGRKLEDSVKTQIFNVDFTMSFDDHTKDLVMKYLSKTTGKKKKLGGKKKVSDLGAYKRLPDIILNDPGISRLHAMIFHDESGIGILDLVSRNGTYVNGSEVEAKLVKTGDEIKIGKTKICVR